MDENNNRISVFICAASFEKDRCLAGPELLMKNRFRADAGIIFLYSHPDLSELRDQCLKKLTHVVGKITDNKTLLISCDLYEPHLCIRKLQSSPNFEKEIKMKKHIVIDASTFTKMHLLMLLKFLDRNGGIPEWLLYTRTLNPIYTRLTEGILQVGSIPGFSGSVSSRKPTLLFLFLGFEPDRASAISRYYEPSITFAILSRISGTESWHKRMIDVHSNLLNRNSVEPITVRADKPLETFKIIKSKFEELGNTYNFCIAPLGTKAQTIGIYEAVRLYPQIQLVYCPPYKYLPNYPRRGKGDTIVYARDRYSEGNTLHYTRIPSLTFGKS